MSKVSRNDVFVRPEKGGEWFEEFLRICRDQKEVLEAVVTKKSEGVAEVVQQYRDMVGLDLVQGENFETETTKVAKSTFLSIRHAASLGPIAPMKLKKLTKADDILKDHDDSEIIVQQKIDGFKTQAIKDAKDVVKLYTRRGESFEANVPSLVSELKSKMDTGDFWLGELAYVKGGKQSISDVQTVVGSNPEKAQAKLKEEGGHLVFYVYDLLWDKGTDITKKPYTERYAKLQKKVGKSKLVEIVKNYPYSDKDKAINDALKVGGEGIVLKPKDSEYKYAGKGQNEPHGEWAKFKPGAKAHTDEVILNKYNKGADKLVFPMYQHKGSELFEVGKLSGMSKEDEAKIKKDIDAGKTVVVEITFQEKMPSGKFRHVGWSRFRPDKPVKEVKYSKANIRFLSIKQAKHNIIELLKQNPELGTMIDSFCASSGGTKNTHSIINFLREKLGHELISFSDQELKDYIQERKDHYKEHRTEDAAALDVGRVGTEPGENYEDHVADYITHGK